MAPASLSAPHALSLLAPPRASSVGKSRGGLSVVPVGVRPVPAVSVAAVGTRRRLVAAAAATEMAPAASGEEGKAFVEEMRAVAMRLHTKDQAREGEKEPQAPPVAKWEPSVDGYLRFLVDSRLVFQKLEAVVDRASVPWYAEFRNTRLERSEALEKDLEWFRQQGHTIPEPSAPGTTYASYLEELSEKDPQAFICHFYNVYFAHTAGGRMIGKKVAEKILNKKELEFYKWEGNLSQLLQNVRNKLNQVASSWSREEKDHCLEETEKSFAYSGDLLRHIFT
ncbi:heme oxygenase 1, chloroplastic-like [Phragmites australis]|uniref:heme oxygenase 1, chloroplastic-like n=1 Tax=Phragmites australis TaxID=29695 RepID=UPI002D7760FF|nr:heme oxygenase 1, chloroplastic-like [Phragmites australis]